MTTTIKIYSGAILYLIIATISNQTAALKIAIKKLITTKLNHTEALIMLCFLLIFQLYLYEFDMSEYFVVYT